MPSALPAARNAFGLPAAVATCLYVETSPNGIRAVAFSTRRAKPLRQLPVDWEFEVVAMPGEVLLKLAAGLVEPARGLEQPRGDLGGEALQDGVLGAVLIEVGDAQQTALTGGDQQPPHGRVERRVGDVEQTGGVRRVTQIRQRRIGYPHRAQRAFKRIEIIHGWYSVRNLLSPSWTLRRAASSLVPITTEISAYGASAT